MGAKIKIQVFDLNGHKVGRIIDQKTLDSDATLKEALSYGYVVGQIPAIASSTGGVLHSMIDSIQRDGNGRKIDDYISLNAYAKGSIKEMTDAYEAKNVVVRAQMLKEFQSKVDPSKFKILIEGAAGTFLIETVSTGEESGVVVLDEDLFLNGNNFAFNPADGDKLTFSVPDTGVEGEVDAQYVTCTPTRITVLRDGLQEMVDSRHDGKEVIFTLKIHGKIAKKIAVMRANA